MPITIKFIKVKVCTKDGSFYSFPEVLINVEDDMIKRKILTSTIDTLPW